MAVRGAVVDLGSSSFQLLVCDIAADGMLVPVAKSRSTLDLGATVGASGSLSHDRVVAAVAVARRLADQLKELAPDVVVALGTAALRDAANGDQVTSLLSEALGVPIRVLDGAAEAILCSVGQRAAVWSGEAPSVGIDLGGGSTEMAVTGSDGVLFADSAPIGATRLRGELGDLDPIGPAGRQIIADRVSAAVSSWGGLLVDLDVDCRRIVASGGTVRALARVATARTRRPRTAAQGSVNQVELTIDQLEALAGHLSRLAAADRLAVPGMPRRRVRSIAYGAAALHGLVATIGGDRVVVSEWGLREGALLDALDHT